MSDERPTEAEQRRQWIDLHEHIEAVIERKLRSGIARHLPVVMLAEDLADVVTSAVLERGASMSPPLVAPDGVESAA